MANRLRHIYEFGPYLLDATERVLHKNGHEIVLRPKTYDVLLVLVQNSGHIVEKETLMREVWPDSFVEEANITQNVSVLKKTLRADGDSYRYIETIPKRGYRFTATTREMLEDVSLTANRTLAPSNAEDSISTYTDANSAANKGHWVLVLSATLSDIEKPIAEALEVHLRKLTNDVNLTLLRIEDGSVIVTLEGTRVGFERINDLVESGQISEVFGFGITVLLWLGSEISILAMEAIHYLTRTFSESFPQGSPITRGNLQEALFLDGARMQTDPLEAIRPAYSRNRKSILAMSGNDKINKRKQECLEKCLLSLSLEEQELILAYYWESDSQINSRKELAAELGIAPSSLRVRIHRIKRVFEKCVSDCMKLSSTDTQEKESGS